MAILDDIAAIKNDGTRSEEQKRKDIYALKCTALLDVILNGKSPPNPIPPLLDRTFNYNGKTVMVTGASQYESNGVPQLLVDIVLNGKSHQVHITNPPVIPATTTGNEKQDLIQTAIEILDRIPVS
jgi:hypothetical protein